MFLSLLRYANMGLAFALELGALAVFCYFGFVTGKNRFMKIGLGLVLPILAIIIWGAFASPQADWHLNELINQFIQ